MRDANEPFAVTDDRGQYVIENIQPPGGSYRLRETLLSARRQVRADTAWRCSLPNAGTAGGFPSGPGGLFGCGVADHTTPYAQGRDFGDWLPAQLTVSKQLGPPTTPGASI